MGIISKLSVGEREFYLEPAATTFSMLIRQSSNGLLIILYCNLELICGFTGILAMLLCGWHLLGLDWEIKKVMIMNHLWKIGTVSQIRQKIIMALI